MGSVDVLVALLAVGQSSSGAALSFFDLSVDVPFRTSSAITTS